MRWPARPGRRWATPCGRPARLLHPAPDRRRDLRAVGQPPTGPHRHLGAGPYQLDPTHGPGGRPGLTARPVRPVPPAIGPDPSDFGAPSSLVDQVGAHPGRRRNRRLRCPAAPPSRERGGDPGDRYQEQQPRYLPRTPGLGRSRSEAATLAERSTTVVTMSSADDMRSSTRSVRNVPSDDRCRPMTDSTTSARAGSNLALTAAFSPCLNPIAGPTRYHCQAKRGSSVGRTDCPRSSSRLLRMAWRSASRRIGSPGGRFLPATSSNQLGFVSLAVGEAPVDVNPPP